MSNHNIIFIRSQDRSSGLTNAFTVNLPTNYNYINSIQLLSAEIPCSFYSISASYSAGVTFTNGTNAYQFSLSSGNYGIADLQSALLAWLQTKYPSQGVTAVNYSTVFGTLSVVFTSGSLSVYNNSSGSLGLILGTDPLGGTTASSGTTLTFPNCVNLFPNTSMFINITNIQPNVLTTNSLNTMFRIQNSSPPGGVILYNAAVSVYNTVVFPSPITNVSQFLITLCYSDGSPVIMNGQNWSLSVGVTYS